MPRLFNVMEILVMETIGEILSNNETLCDCERCRMDIAALALNELPNLYVVTAEGEVMQRTRSLRQQTKVDVIKAVSRAISRVADYPHHQKKKAGS